jgi:cytoskeletal protein RodZ
MGLGQVLRTARTTRGLSLADLQSRTKVRVKYLSALEDERYEDLPPFPYARGFVLAAAQELGLDGEPLVARLGQVMAALPGAQGGERPRVDAGVTPAVRRARFRRTLTMIGGAFAIVGVALAVYFAQQLRQLSQPAPPPGPIATSTPAPTPMGSMPTQGVGVGAAASPQPSPGAAAPATPAPSALASPTPQGPTQPYQALAGADGITLEITVAGASWLRVIGDGRTLFEGVVRDETRRWQARRMLTLRVGNGGAVSGAVNGQPFGVMGRNGQIVNRTFRIAGP